MSRRAESTDAALLLLAAAALLVGVTWLAVHAAAYVHAGRWCDVGAADAAAALPELILHPANPRRSWPPGTRDLIPGAFVYWTVAAPLYLAAVIGTFWGIALYLRWVGTHRRRFGVDTRARLATSSDLAPLIVRGPVPGRLVIGRHAHHLLATEAPPARRRRIGRRGDRSSVLVIGPTRCGKTTNAIAGILGWTGPAILSSVKSDLLDATLDARLRHGDVKIFDPTGTTGRECASWSPLRDAATITGAQKAARALADACPRDGVEDLGFFLSLGEQLLWALLWTAANAENKTMRDVVRWVLTQDRTIKGRPGEVAGLVARSKERGVDPADAAFVLTTLRAAWDLEDRVRSNVYATVQTMIRAWSDPGVAAASITNDIDLAWLLEKSNTLYICAPRHEQDRLTPVFAGLVGDLLQQAFERVGRTNEPLPPTLIVLDEAGNTPARWLPGVASTCAGIGIQLVTIWQSKAQIDAAYGPLADSVVTNHGTKIIFSGVSDLATLSYASTLVGDEEIVRLASSIDSNSKRRTETEAAHSTPLLPVHLLRQARPGHALLVHGTLPPAHIRALRPPGRARRPARSASE